MAIEIERKFLLSSDIWRSQAFQTLKIKQAYFCNTSKASVRVRISDDQAFISTKTMTHQLRRHEFEYPIPMDDAEFMLNNLCQGSAIIKQRHLVRLDNHLWEIDEFAGDNDGLIVAEVELESEQQVFNRPEWLGQEVSDDPRYLNMSLVQQPFKKWTT